MKKVVSVVIILTALALTTSAFGQTSSDLSKTNKYVYCELTEVPITLSNYVHVKADFGEETKGIDNQKLKDEKTGKPRIFNSIVDALNYMSDEGWEVITAYATIKSTCTYLLRKIKEIN